MHARSTIAARLVVVVLSSLVSASAGAAVGEAPACLEASEVAPPYIGSGAADLARIAELTGRMPVRSHGLERRSGRWTRLDCATGSAPHHAKVPARSSEGYELRTLPLRSESLFHSAYADDRNDGILFGGRGLSSALSAGIEGRWRWLSAGFAPVAAWQQNRAYDVPAFEREGFSPFANPFNGGAIDLPTRFGPDAFWTLHPGQSYARVDAFGAALGFSTENLWWGPGLRNSILLSSSAAGFPHVFVGTSRPVDIWIGWLEAELFWGRLKDSGWFDSDPTNDRRLLTALALTYEPRFAPNLHLGILRVYDRVVPPGGFSFGDYFTPITEPFFKNQIESSPGEGGPENQLVSLTARWAFPEVALEIYGEYGRDDHSWDFKDFMMEPGHAAAYLAGVQKVVAVGGRRVRLLAETARTFEKPAATPTRGTPIFYTHSSTRTGYTNRGQMLGAGIGPQADSQFVAADLLTRGGRFGLYFERVLRNERFFPPASAPAARIPR